MSSEEPEVEPGSTGTGGWFAGLVTRVLALRERFTGAGRRSPKVDRLLLAGAGVLFVGSTVLAIRGLPHVHSKVRWHLLVLTGLLGVPAAALVNAAEYAAAGRALGHRIRAVHAARVSVVATAANLLPIPGALMVRARALRVLGSNYRKSLGVLGAIGVIWLGMTGLLAGAVVLVDGERLGLGLAFVGGGVVAGAGAFVLLRLSIEPSKVVHWFVRFGVIEIASVLVFALRFDLVLNGLGYHTAWSQTITLTIASAAASAVGILPGGLGLREILAGALAPLVGLKSAVALFAVSVDRIIGLVVLALMSGALVFVGRGDPIGAMEDDDAADLDAPASGD